MVSTRVRVVTYNVLSSHLASSSHFTKCSKGALKSSRRLERLKARLTTECAKDSVVCLQEVSQRWVGELLPFFEAKNYRMVHYCYGSAFSGYMGVALAYPGERYSTDRIDMTRVADTAPNWPRQTKDGSESKAGWGDWAANVLSWPARWWRERNQPYLLRVSKLSGNPWEEAETRKNVLVSARLVDRETQVAFWVSTYHMPCLFGEDWRVAVMNIHAALAARHVHKLADNGATPYVLAGDFNIKPDSSSYELLTKGKIDSSHPQIAQWPADCVNPDEAWPSNVTNALLASAYCVKDGCEPEVTNYAQIKDDPLFHGTLDYIFLSTTGKGGRWTVESVAPLPRLAEMKGSLPTEDEPSDHLQLAADLMLSK